MKDKTFIKCPWCHRNTSTFTYEKDDKTWIMTEGEMSTSSLDCDSLILRICPKCDMPFQVITENDNLEVEKREPQKVEFS